MKLIGLIGGMSWESSLEYYRLINESVRQRRGGLHSARCVMYSLDFAEIEALQAGDRWDETAVILSDAARSLVRAGAELIVLCTNTMHKVAHSIEKAVTVPLLHIADATAAEIRGHGLQTVGLLGTRFTMEEEFYASRLSEIHGLQIVVPPPDGREMIHRVIYDELCRGEINPASRACYLDVIAELGRAGAQGVILGCTEIGLLIKQSDSRLPLFDTTAIHAAAAVDFALTRG
ncbi:MAG: aspartate/glutamate racemase family protein [Spirochaetaceae bacterium]|nr:MAG: aspartate/glutamate racemase family protein [Spirochaetaceae bacterium]